MEYNSYPISDSVELPFRHFEFQRSFEGSPPQTAHAFYCLSEDRASGGSASLTTQTRLECSEIVLNGRAANVFVPYWTAAGIWDSRSCR